MPSVAVCVVSHNSAEDLPGCLAAIDRLEHETLEIVIVDCASSDESVEIASRHRSRHPLTFVPLEHNAGFAGGMNEALGRTDAAFILSLNPDASPEPTFVTRLLERFESSTALRVGAVTGRLLRPRREEREIVDAAGMHLTLAWRHFDRGSNEVDRGQYSVPERVFGATGAATLFARPALDDVALDGEVFLEEFHTYREDAELSFRLRERGWEILYEPRAGCRHRRVNLPEHRRKMSAAVNYHSLKNRYLLRLYHQTASDWWLTLAPALARDVAIAAYAVAAERSSLAAYGWLWRNRSRIMQRRRLIQRRRSVPPRAVNRWFLRRALPL